MLWVQGCHAFSCMLHHLQFRTPGRSGGHCSLLFPPAFALQPNLTAKLGTGSIPRCWSKPWGKRPSAVCPSQRDYPELSLPSMSSCLLSTGAYSTNVSRMAPLSNLATLSQPLSSWFFSQDPKSSLGGSGDGRC